MSARVGGIIMGIEIGIIFLVIIYVGFIRGAVQ